MGCVVHSERRSFQLDEISMGGSIVDFGQAVVRIPDREGEWVLTGHVLAHIKDRFFIGRNALLKDPQGKIVSQAAQIVVPIESPADFKTKDAAK